MLPTKSKSTQSKIFFFHGNLPQYVKETQPPQTKRPFSTIAKTKWAHTMRLTLPLDLLDTVERQLQDSSQDFKYGKVMMSLNEILSGDFFNHYIKQGNISMLSEGRREVDNIFSLRDGILRIEVDRATYERTGLVGSAISDGGQKHKKTRFLIQMNLRLPSMLHGKKGFDRLVWASKHILNRHVTWLFFDHSPQNSQRDDGPIRGHHPLWMSNTPQLLFRKGSSVPRTFQEVLRSELREEIIKDGESMLSLEEWFSLLMMDSSRVAADDNIDPYICRYQAPGQIDDEKDISTTSDLVCLAWHGFFPSELILKVFLLAIKTCKAQWSGFSFTGFDGETTTILQLPQEKSTHCYLEWDCATNV